MPLEDEDEDEVPLEEIPGDWSEAFSRRLLLKCACLGGMFRDKSEKRVLFP